MATALTAVATRVKQMTLRPRPNWFFFKGKDQVAIDLKKSADVLRVSLTKRGLTKAPSAKLAFILDVSWSFEIVHRDGKTQALLKRLVPWGIVFDPDQQLDMFSFSSSADNAHHVGVITPDTCDGYIQKDIINRVPGWKCGTDYSYVLELALRHFGWIPNAPKPSGGGIFGGARKPSAQTIVERKKSIVLFVTDGDNNDHDRCRKVLKESETRRDDVYFIFICISNGGSRFAFLQKIADEFSNTGFTYIPNIDDFLKLTDDQVNDLLIGDELIAWLNK
jgi:hypothetical protein